MAVRSTQTVVEALTVPTTPPAVRSTQTVVEALTVPTTPPNIRSSNTFVEVLISPVPQMVAANARLRGASNKGGKKNSGNTSLVIDKPTQTAEGDTLIAVVADNAGTNTSITPPTGWVLAQPRQTSTTVLGQAIYTYLVPAAAPASFTWTLTGTVNSVGIINVLGNVGDLEAIGTQTNASSVNVVAPSITTLSENALLIYAGTVAASATFTPPTGMTENPDSDQNAVGVSTTFAFQVPFNPIGTTGTRTGVASGAGVNIGTLMAFEPVNIERFDFTANAVIMPSFTADAVLSPEPLTSQFTGVPGKFNATPGHIALGRIAEAPPEVGGTFSADSILFTVENVSFTADATLSIVQFEQVTADAVIQRIESHTFDTDSILQTVNSESFTADAQLLGYVESSVVADAVLFKTTDANFIANTTLRREEQDSFAADALLRVVVSNTFSAGSVILRTSAGSFSANSVLLKTTDASFVSSSILRKIETFDFSGDATLLKIVSVGISANAILLGTIDGTFTANAKLYPMAESARPAVVGPADPEYIVIGSVPSHLRSGLPEIRLQPGGVTQVGQGRVSKRVRQI